MKEKKVQFNKQKFKPAFKTEVVEADNTTVQDLQMIGLLLHFYYIFIVFLLYFHFHTDDMTSRFQQIFMKYLTRSFTND